METKSAKFISTHKIVLMPTDFLVFVFFSIAFFLRNGWIIDGAHILLKTIRYVLFHFAQIIVTMILFQAEQLFENTIFAFQQTLNRSTNMEVREREQEIAFMQSPNKFICEIKIQITK